MNARRLAVNASDSRCFVGDWAGDFSFRRSDYFRLREKRMVVFKLFLLERVAKHTT
jgi:hypothetical protein